MSASNGGGDLTGKGETAHAPFRYDGTAIANLSFVHAACTCFFLWFSDSDRRKPCSAMQIYVHAVGFVLASSSHLLAVANKLFVLS